jgi:phosphoglycolate phosphatase
MRQVAGRLHAGCVRAGGIERMTYRLVIFDLDGTLADSFPWFLQIVNSVADRHGFRRIEAHEVDALRGYGSREIIKHMGVPAWKLPFIAKDMRTLKATATTPLFPGVETVLEMLSQRNLILALVTSDAEDNARRALGTLARHISYFDCGASLFGKAAKFKRLLSKTGISPDQAIAIGDEVRDIEAAHQAGVDFGAVSWGYAKLEAIQKHHPKMVFRSMEEIATKLADCEGRNPRNRQD